MSNARTRVALVVAAFGIAATGCRNIPHEGKCHRVPNHDGTVTVRVEGDVMAPKTLTLPPGRAMLSVALQGAGGADEIKNAYGQPLLTFAKFTRGGDDYYVATPLVEDTALGDVGLQNGDVITVLPWTETDLARGVIVFPSKVQGPGVPSKTTTVMDIQRDGFDYDDRTLRMAYALPLGSTEMRFLKVTVADAGGGGGSRDKFVPDLDRVIVPPNLFAMSSTTEGGIFNPAMSVSRVVGGVTSHFITNNPKNRADDVPTYLMLKIAPIFQWDAFVFSSQDEVSIPGPSPTQSVVPGSTTSSKHSHKEGGRERFFPSLAP